MLLPTHEGAPPLPYTALEDTEHSELWIDNYSSTLKEEFYMNRLLIEEEMKKTTDRNESFVDDSFAERTKQITPPPPPPPLEESSDSDFNVGHGSAHIPLYEGDEDPRRHRFVCESTWEANQVMDEDRQMA